MGGGQNVRHWGQRNEKVRSAGSRGSQALSRNSGGGFFLKDRKMEKKGQRKRQFPEHELGEGAREKADTLRRIRKAVLSSAHA